MDPTTVTVTPVMGFRPHKTSTLTMYSTTRSMDDDIRSNAPVTRYHLGPGAKVIGGKLLNAYEERPESSVRLDPTDSAAPKDVLNELKQSTLRDPTALLCTSSAMQSAPPPPKRNAGVTSTSGRQDTTTSKVVYWDGNSHHVVNAPANGEEWRVPHLVQSQLAGPQHPNGRQMPGSSSTKLIGGTHRLVAPADTQTWTDRSQADETLVIPRSRSLSYGMGPADPPSTLRQYSVTKAIGHQEYEAAVKSLGGLGSWSLTQQDLRSHVNTARPSRILSPLEHAGTGLTTLRASGRL